MKTGLTQAITAASAELQKRGLTEVAADANPDLNLFSISATRGMTGTYWECAPGYYWYGWTYIYDPCAWMVPINFYYTEGTVVVGVADPKLQKVVFGGAVQGILECSADLTGARLVGCETTGVDLDGATVV